MAVFPEVRVRMQENLIQYQDKYKCWQKFQLLNVEYFRDLSVETYEELILNLQQEVYQSGEQIIKQGEYYDRVFILASGEVELYLQLPYKEIPLELISEVGCTINQVSCIVQEKIGFSARAVKSVQLLSISMRNLNLIMSRRKDLKKKVSKCAKENTLEERPVLEILDYTRRKFWSRIGERPHETPKQRALKQKKLRLIMQSAYERIRALLRYNKQKEGKLQELIKRLKRQNSFKLRQEAKKVEEVIKE